MDIIFLIILLGIFIVPTFLMSRRQRARMTEIQKLQDSVVPGDRIVTTAGQHATVVSTTADTVDLEIAPGFVSTFEKLAVVRVLFKADAPQIVEEPTLFDDRSEIDDVDPQTDNNFDDRADGHPENR
ncbi:preprotein translocase subunit YajC [Corynebacterium crudilactis]|uniref:Preprotein translocase subunit YajC n=1 Tax=Corynebacterium crudilactis TaxID=1652495 RepID=A0A172QXA0_9CORY|nr:preprotein translocase subunit YajC [Corynebacterium crudilactis]ANE05339.1 preprotein translocase subunit YajC [Corynebacterium crudilactis]